MNNAQHAFRVRLHTTAESALVSIRETAPEPIHTRRAHTKSRLGCEYCKQRRKKCDERKPACSLCTKKNKQCRYTGVTQTQQRRAIRPLATSSLQSALWPGPKSPSVLTIDRSETTHTKYDLFLVDHWVKRSARYFEGPESTGIYSTKALDLAKEYPFVMHAMIALAACHLQHVGIDARCYRMPEAFHTRLASRGLRDAVVSINGAKEADSVLTTAMLLNSLTFCIVDYRENEQEIAGMPRWDWLKIGIGLTDLLIRTKPFHPESIWRPLFVATDTCRVTDSQVNDLDKKLAAFCGIDESSTEDNNPYFGFWEQLAPVVTRRPDLKYVRKYVNAIGGVNHSFVGLLEERDPAALLLFAQWSALMSLIRTWWSAARTERICWATCEILQKRFDSEDMDLLELPAKACGYPLSCAEGAGC